MINLAESALSLLNSNVYKWPFGEMLLIIAIESTPLPVPRFFQKSLILINKR